MDQPIALGSEWTISARFKDLQLGNGAIGALTREEGNRDIHIEVSDTGELGTRDRTTDTFYSSGYNMSSLSSSDWHTLTAVGKDGKTLFYINNQHVGTSDYQSLGSISSIGNAVDSATPYVFAQFIDDFRVYNEALVPEIPPLSLGLTEVAINDVIAEEDIVDLVFVPDANANGLGYSNLQYTVSDATLESTAHTLTFDVTAVNDAPQINFIDIPEATEPSADITWEFLNDFTSSTASHSFSIISGNAPDILDITYSHGQGAANFNGSDSKLLSDLGENDYPATVGLWFRSSDEGTLFELSNNQDNSIKRHVMIGSDGRLHSTISYGADTETIVSDGSINFNDGEWHYLSHTVTNVQQLVVDGIQVAQGTNQTIITSQNNGYTPTVTLNEDFSGTADNWITAGSAVISGGNAILTADTNSQSGAILYDQAMSATNGVSVAFDLTNSSASDNGDGGGFALVNGDTTNATNFSAGSVGGNLGIADMPGLALGIGFSEWWADKIQIWGSAHDPVATIDISSFGAIDNLTVPIQIDISSDGLLDVSISYNGGTSYTQVINDLSLAANGITLPDSIKPAFAAGTGGSTAQHAVDNISITASGNNSTSLDQIVLGNSVNQNLPLTGDIAHLSLYQSGLSLKDVKNIILESGNYALSTESNEDQINTTTDSDQHQSAIAATDDGGAISVWVSQSGGTYTIMGQRFTQEPQIRNITVGDHSFESVSLSDSDYILQPSASAWTFSSGANGIHNYSASMLTQETSDGNNAGYINTDNATISQVLSDTFSRNEQYTLQVDIGNRQDAAGFSDYEVRLKAGGVVLASDGSVTPAEGEFSTLTLTIDGASIPADSAAIGQPLEIELVKISGEQIAFDNVRLTASSEGQIREGSEFKLNTIDPVDSSHFFEDPKIAVLDNGNYAITWISHRPGIYLRTQMRIFDAEHNEIKSEFSIRGSNGDQSNVLTSEITALSDNRFAIVRQIPGSPERLDIQIFDAQGNELVVSNQFGVGSIRELEPDITALDNGGFAVTWRDRAAGDNTARLMLFDNTGTAISSELAFGSSAPLNDSYVSMAAIKSGQVITSYQSGDNLFLQRWSPDGTTEGGPIRINSTTAGTQSQPDITALADGSFYITWTSENQDGDGNGIYGRHFGADGIAISGETLINETATGNQSDAHVVQLSDGTLQTIWTSDQNGNNDILSRTIAIGNQVTENATTGTLVGQVTATDLEGDAITYSLLDDSEGRFTIDSTTGVITVADGSKLNYEANSQHTIIARATDSQGAFSDQTLTLKVNDQIEQASSADASLLINQNESFVFSEGVFEFKQGDGVDSLQSVTISSLPTLGSLTLNGATISAGQTITAADLPLLVYTAGTSGTGSFGFTVSDGATSSTEYTFNIDAQDATVSTNLVTNPGATSGTSGWSVIANGGNGWSTTGGNHDGDGASWITSYGWARKSQTIDLLSKGFSADYLDSQPTISVSDWYSQSSYGGDLYNLKVQLRDASNNVIASYDTGTLTAVSGWTEAAHVFENYGTGVRSIYIEHGGRDGENWGGHYGTRIDDTSITIGEGQIQINGTANDDILAGSAGNDELSAQAGHDKLYGFEGDDTLSAGDGDDLVVGGSGSDTLTGGSGADTFDFDSADMGTAGSPAVDTITDFNLSEGDVLDIQDQLTGLENNAITNFLTIDQSDANSPIIEIRNSANGDITQKIKLEGLGQSALASFGTSDIEIITGMINAGHLIVGNQPVVNRVYSDNSNNWYKEGDTLTLKVEFSGTVNVTGTPTLELDEGRIATYSGGTGTNTLEFTYTITNGEESPDLNVISTSALQTAGGTITSATGGTVNLTLPALTSANSLVAQSNIRIDSVDPVIGLTSGNVFAEDTNVLVLTGSGFDSLLSPGEGRATNLTSRLDWSKFEWQVVDNSGSNTDIGFSAGDIRSVFSMADDKLYIRLQDSKMDAIKNTAGYGDAEGSDIVRITSDGFFADAAGNTTTDQNSGIALIETAAPSNTGQTHTGTNSTDTLIGGSGDDILIGGAGSDILIGGSGADTFDFNSGDAGTASDPTLDLVQSFNLSEGDRLDLKDLLIGEESGDLTDYLSFDHSGDDSIMEIRETAGGDVTQKVQLQDVDLSVFGTTDAEIITGLINGGHLDTDQ